MNRIYLTGLLISLGFLTADLFMRPLDPQPKPLLAVATEVEQWVYAHARYETESLDEWATPEETLRRGFGDCEDLALLFAEHLHRLTGYQATLVIVHYGSHPIDLLHAEVEVAGERFMRPVDLSNEELHDNDLVDRLTYDDAQAIARGWQSLRLRWPR